MHIAHTRCGHASAAMRKGRHAVLRLTFGVRVIGTSLDQNHKVHNALHPPCCSCAA